MAYVAKDTSPKKSESNAVFTELYEILEQGGCPYTLDIDDEYLGKLLMEPSEYRLRMLMWIFSQVHESNEEIITSLDDRNTNLCNPTIDRRIQILTSLASTVGLCRPVDVELLQGGAASSRHIAFWRGVTDILKFSNDSRLCSIYDNDCRILDRVHTLEDDLLRQTFSSVIELLPPSMNAEIKTLSSKERKSMQKASLIEAQLLELSKQLEAEVSLLKKSKKDCMYVSEPDNTSIESVCRKMDLTLADLDQMITTFDQVFVNSYLPYCDKKEEELGELGSLFQIVAKQFSHVIETFDSLGVFMESNERLCKCSSALSATKHKLESRMNMLTEAEEILKALINSLENEMEPDRKQAEESHLHLLLSGMCSLR